MADQILADPSKRRLFEKDDIFSLLNVSLKDKQEQESTFSNSEDDLEEGELPKSK